MSNEWQPTERDRQWLRQLINKLKIGGVWHSPTYGFTFKKTGENELTLISIETPMFMLPHTKITIERTVKIGEQIGVKVKTKAESILVF